MIRLTRAQVREIDRRSIEDFHIPGIVLMENAARAAASLARLTLHGTIRPSALILCGGGNNGGDGLGVARHLHNMGVEVQVALTVPTERYAGDALTNLRIVQAMGLPLSIVEAYEIPATWGSFSLVVDALFGTGLTSPPRDTRWIDFMNEQPAPVLAIDLPSGIDCDTGEPLGTCVRAARTVTFVAEKAGFVNPASNQYTGHIETADIGCPRELVEEVAKMSPT